eukprot:gene5286-10577_t
MSNQMFRIILINLLVRFSAPIVSAYQYCGLSIEDDVKQSLLYPGALTIPHGRAFIAQHFGIAFIYTSQELHEISLTPRRFDGLSPIVQNHWKLRGTISACRLNQTNVVNIKPNMHISNISAISFYGRLAGPEIVVANITQFQTDDHEFRWTVSFPPVSETGIYELFIMTDWIFDGRLHAAKEPYHQSQYFRVNEGLTLHIGGLGGYSEEFVRHRFPVIKELPMSKTFQKSKQIIISNEFRTILQNLRNHFSLFYGDISWEQSLVYHSHQYISIKSHENNIQIASNSNHHSIYATYSSTLPLCGTTTTNDTGSITSSRRRSIMKGRWVREPLCDHYTQSYATNEKMRESNNGNGNNGNGNNGLWPAPGSECSHSVSQLTNRFRNRSNSMVWRPYTCQLAHYNTCQHNNINNNRCSDKRHPQSYLSAQDCLKARNILFIAGFGDSLGSEQWNNFYSILDLHDTSTFLPTTTTNKEKREIRKKRKERNKIGKNMGNYDDKVKLECMGRLTGYHKIESHSSDKTPLIQCIKDTLHLELQQRKHVFERKTKEPLTIVLATNFAVQHALEFSMSTSIRLLERQVEVHNQLAQELLHDYNIVYRRIFMTGVRTHGFRYPWLSPQRMEMLNRHASDILGRAGWEIFDAYPITVGRPDGVVDSLHYRGGVSLAMTDALLTMICHG